MSRGSHGGGGGGGFRGGGGGFRGGFHGGGGGGGGGGFRGGFHGGGGGFRGGHDHDHDHGVIFHGSFRDHNHDHDHDHGDYRYRPIYAEPEVIYLPPSQLYQPLYRPIVTAPILPPVAEVPVIQQYLTSAPAVVLTADIPTAYTVSTRTLAGGSNLAWLQAAPDFAVRRIVVRHSGDNEDVELRGATDAQVVRGSVPRADLPRVLEHVSALPISTQLT